MGRPKGSKNDTLWRDALRKAALDRLGEEGPQKIEVMASRVVEAVIGGDMSAAREFGNRLDGAPRQTVDIDQHVTHDLRGISDDRLAAILIEEEGSAGSAKAPDDQGIVH